MGLSHVYEDNQSIFYQIDMWLYMQDLHWRVLCPIPHLLSKHSVSYLSAMLYPRPETLMVPHNTQMQQNEYCMRANAEKPV